MDNKKLEKWKTWIKDIHEDVFRQIDIYREIFREISTLMDENPSRFNRTNHMNYYLPNTIYYYLSIGIRRHIKAGKKNDKSKSFATLLVDMKNNPIKICAPKSIDDRCLGGATSLLKNGHLVSEEIEKDYHKLIEKTKEITAVIDKCVVHFDQKSPRENLNIRKVDVAFDFLKSLVEKYHLLLRCSTGGSYDLVSMKEDVKIFLGLNS